MMESSLEEGGATAFVPGLEEGEIGRVEQMSYAQEQFDEGIPPATSVNKESDTDSDKLDMEEEVPTLILRKRSTVSSEHGSQRKLEDDECYSTSDKASINDTESEGDNLGDDGDSLGLSSLENVHDGSPRKKGEIEGFRKPISQEERSSLEVLTNKEFTPSLVGMASESAELEGQISFHNPESPISICQEECQRDVNSSSESSKVPEESKPSLSHLGVPRNVMPDSIELGENGSEEGMKTEEEYLKKGFMCSGETEEQDEQLREYWTRALQTSTSTGEIVEEIVKVLKHHQKTHDLLCPVCGSCVTRRVILRKRKRSSYISVDRWYRDPLDEGEVQEQEGAVPEVEDAEVEESDTHEDIEAFGCLSCFSLFLSKGRQLLNQLHELGPDRFNCLPFFFPPYPWGMTQLKPRNTGSQAEAPRLDVAEEAPTMDVQDASSTSEGFDLTCGIGSTLLPDYPWGTTQLQSAGRPSGQTEITVEAGSSVQDVEQEREDIVDGSHRLSEGGLCNCGLAPTFIPAYPWGVCRKHVKGLEDAGAVSQSVEDAQPSINESTCTCGIAEALFPDYRWGHLTKADEIALESPSDLEVGPQESSPAVPEEAILEREPQPETSEAVPRLEREERSCTCGLLPALIPNYPWGITGKEKGADSLEIKTDTPVQTLQETEGKAAQDKLSSCDLASALLPVYPWGVTSEAQEDVSNLREKMESEGYGASFLHNGAHIRIGSAVLPSYPWGKCSVHQSVHEENGNLQLDEDAADKDCTCGMGLTMLPKFPWGQTPTTVGSKQQHPKVSSQEVKNYSEQETKIEARITSKTDVFTVTSTKLTYPGEKPPQNIKAMIPHETSQTIQHVKLDQMVTVINASVKVNEAAGSKHPPLASHPSTGFALLDLGEEALGGKERLQTRPSTGYAHLEEQLKEQECSVSEIEEDPVSLKYETKADSTWQPAPQDKHEKMEAQTSPTEETYYKPETMKPQTLPTKETHYKHEILKTQTPPTGTQFPSFEWSVGKLDAGDLTSPLLKASIEPETETFISVMKPAPVEVDKPKSENWLSVFKVSKPSDDGGLTAPLLSPVSAFIEEIEEVKRPVSRPEIQASTEAVIDVPPSDVEGTAVGAAVGTAPALTTKEKKEADDWDILKSIVYGGLDISIASLGVTSSAAGGNAITRTVVYMGLATLFSGLIAFYHNVLNLYHYHRDHYIDVVGLTLMLHGTVAFISFVVFGLLSPLVYAFSYRETDDRDDKFILCCGVTIVAVTALALGKAKVSNKRYIRTLFAYLGGGVLAAIIGYLTGEHVAELLEEWGI